MTTSENSPDSSGEPMRYHIARVGKWVEMVEKIAYDKEVPVTVNFDMNRQVGTAKIAEDAHGLRVDMKIHDPAAQAILRGEDLTHLSINTAHFVRDKEQERRLPWQH